MQTHLAAAATGWREKHWAASTLKVPVMAGGAVAATRCERREMGDDRGRGAGSGGTGPRDGTGRDGTRS
jgi:hypothetical protein